MQKKQLIIGLVVGIALLGTFFALREPERDLSTLAPKTIKAMPDLTRVEILPSRQSTGNDGMGKYAGEMSIKGNVPKRIVLEKRDKKWFIVEPFNAPASDLYARRLNDALSVKRPTDDIAVAPEQRDTYALTEPLRTEVKFFTKDLKTPALRLFVGKELVVPQTKARRTFIQFSDDKKIYRLQASLGFLRHRSPDAMRSRVLLMLKPMDVQTLRFEHKGQPPVEIKRKDDKWVLVTPELKMRLDTGTINFMLEALKKLSISGFENDLTPAKAGLDDPDVTVTISGGGEVATPISLDIKKISKEPDFTSTYLVRIKGRNDVFSITPLNGGHLTPDLDRLRDLHPYPIDIGSVTGISLFNRDHSKKIILEKKKGNWTMVAPEASDVVDTVQMDSMLKYLTNMRVGRYAFYAKDTGLRPEDKPETVEIRTTKGPVRLLIGAKVPNTKDTYYGQFEGVKPPFILTKYMIRRFKPKLKDMLPPAKNRKNATP